VTIIIPDNGRAIEKPAIVQEAPKAIEEPAEPALVQEAKPGAGNVSLPDNGRA